MRLLSALLVSIAVASPVASASGGSSNQSGDQNRPVNYATDGTFTMALNVDWGNLDPYRTLNIDKHLAYDSLVNMPPDGEFVSGLAEEWSVDANSATFTLHPDVTCSDGTPLTASHVAAAINYVSDPNNESPQYGLQTPAVPLTATGDDATRTVEVVLEEPFGFLLETIGQLPIMCPKGLEDPDVLASGSDGTGPFVLTEIIPGQSYTFIVRDDYTWGPDGASTSEPGTPSTVVVRIIENETTAANLLLSGELNFAKITGEDAQRLTAEGLEKLEMPQAGAWLVFNHSDGRPTADQRVRQALVHALDLDEVIKVSSGGTGSVSTGLAAMEPRPCAGPTVADHLPEHDVAAAETLLDQAGWTKGADGTRSKDGEPLTLDLHYLPSGSTFSAPTAELLAERWEALGVQVELSADDVSQQSNVLFETRNYDVWLTGFRLILPTVMVPFLSGPLPPEGLNIADIDNEDYNELVAKAASLTPPEACTYWDQAEQALYREVDIAPISNRTETFFLNEAQAQITPAEYEFPIATSLRVLD